MEDALPTSNVAVSPPPRVGRPPAKHSSPDYVQMTVYIQKAVRNAVKMRLFQEGRELSALVENLLKSWLENGSEETL
jgi:hypothetical protein